MVVEYAVVEELVMHGIVTVTIVGGGHIVKSKIAPKIKPKIAKVDKILHTRIVGGKKCQR